jgi:hypothetical protein
MPPMFRSSIHSSIYHGRRKLPNFLMQPTGLLRPFWSQGQRNLNLTTFARHPSFQLLNGMATKSCPAVACQQTSYPKTITMKMLLVMAATAAGAASTLTNDTPARCNTPPPIPLDFTGRWCLDHTTSDEVWQMMKSLGAPLVMAPFADTGELMNVIQHSPSDHMWRETLVKKINYLPQFTRENIFHLDGRICHKTLDGGIKVATRAFVEEDGLVVTETEHPQYGAAQRIERRLVTKNNTQEYRVRNIICYRNKEGNGVTTRVYRRNFVREEDYRNRR